MDDSFSADADVVHDPRLLIREGELTSILRVASRDGSVLSAVIRDAWDGRQLQNNVKKSRLVAPAGSMITIVADVTLDELRRELHSSEIANGFANRFLFGVVRRTKKIARPVQIDVSKHVEPIRDVLRWAQRIDSPIGFTEPGAQAWGAAYERLEDEAEQAGGLAPNHIESALTVWDYSASSVRHIFASASGDPIADKIVEAVDRNPEGLTMTKVYALGGNHDPKARIELAIERLVGGGRYELKEQATRPRQAVEPDLRWTARASCL